MLKMMKYLLRYWWQVILVIGFVVSQAFINLQLPDYMSQIVNDGVVQGDTSVIVNIGLKMLGITFLGIIVSALAGLFISRLAGAFSRDIRADIFAKVESFSMGEFNKFSAASLITRTTNDVQQVRMLLQMGRLIIMAPAMGVGALLKAISMAPGMTWILGVSVGGLFILMLIVFFISMPKFKKVQAFIDKINLAARENLTGLRVIRAFNAEAVEEGKFTEANKDLTKVNLFIGRLMALLQPAMSFVFQIVTIGVVWVGAMLIDLGTLELGNMMAFINYAMHVMFSFMLVGMMFIMIPRASVSANRIKEVLETKSSVNDPASPISPASDLRGLVEFKNVSFGYPGAEDHVLKEINFTAGSGKTTAFIGSTGCGKSTLVNLIMRFYDVSEGEVLVDGVDVRQLLQKDLRGKIGYIPQKGTLFRGTVESNIKYGRESAEAEDIREAAETAQALKFIEELEGGFSYKVAQGGSNVSGGQKQRLSIARALVKKPEIYIFDDSFSALDFKTDKALRAALKERMSDATVLIVAQRINTILNADQIIVLDNGVIVGRGTHRELMKNCAVYQEIAYSQLSKEELA